MDHTGGRWLIKGTNNVRKTVTKPETPLQIILVGIVSLIQGRFKQQVLSSILKEGLATETSTVDGRCVIADALVNRHNITETLASAMVCDIQQQDNTRTHKNNPTHSDGVQ